MALESSIFCIMLYIYNHKLRRPAYFLFFSRNISRLFFVKLRRLHHFFIAKTYKTFIEIELK
ncbi:hypothetical protein CKA32_005544 [Geitlerinema sp. FC II]|nr:hypothetical protein CKA32_005544 [Geitlerinema sp. FC II]